MKPIYIMAEVGQAHEGSILLAHSYIDALANTGVNAVKFQMHIAAAESSVYENFRVKPPFSEMSRFDYWRSMEFTRDEWAGLKKHCLEKKLDFVISPFSVEAVRLAAEIGVSKFKIGSAEVSDYLILSHVSEVCKNVIISSGMSDLAELDKTIAMLKSKNCDLTLLQCTTSYPTPPDQWGLNCMQLLRDRYKIPIGFSDHSGDIYACLAAASLGASMLEFHVIFDKRMPCPDAAASLTIDQIVQLVKGIRQIETALQNPVDKSDNSAFQELRFLFGKSLAVNKSLPKDHILTFEDLESKKPAGCGLPVNQFGQVIGKQLSTNLDKWEFLKKEHIK